jgi:hypothetical protein
MQLQETTTSPETGTTPIISFQNKPSYSIINILCNNIAGADKKYSKMARLVQVIDDQNIDVFVGQEISRQTKNQKFRPTQKYFCQYKQHIVTAETKWLFQSDRKEGGTFCITRNKMHHLILKKIVDHMG